MSSAFDAEDLNRKIATTVAFTAALKNPSSNLQVTLAPHLPLSSTPAPALAPAPSPAAPKMAFRSRGQLLFSRAHLLGFTHNGDKDDGGVVRRLKTRISSWKLLSRHSKTHANLASLSSNQHREETLEKLERLDMPLGMGRTCTVADINLLAGTGHRLNLRTPSLCSDDTGPDSLAQDAASSAEPAVEPNPFAEEDVFDTSLDAVLKLTPDPLGSSTPRRALSVLDPNAATVHRRSVSKVEKPSSLSKQDSGLSFAPLRSSPDLGRLGSMEIPQRRSSILCLAASHNSHTEQQRFVPAGNDAYLATRRKSMSRCNQLKSPSRGSSLSSSSRSATAQDVSQLCCQRQHHGRRPSPPSRKALPIHYETESRERRASASPSSVQPETPMLIRTGRSSSAENMSLSEKNAKPLTLRNPERNPPAICLSTSVPRLKPTLRRGFGDTGDTLYKCLPVEDGKKHPSPTKFEWEDLKYKWQMGVRAEREVYI